MNHFHLGQVRGPSGPLVPTPRYGVVIYYDPKLAENLTDLQFFTPLHAQVQLVTKPADPTLKTLPASVPTGRKQT